MASLKDILRDAVGNPISYNKMKQGRVKSISGLLCDVEPVDGTADLLDVRITPDSNTGIKYTPKLNSIVTVGFVADGEGLIVAFTEIDKIEIDCNDIVFNGGTNDGLILINALVTKLNNLENKVNSILSTFNTHTHTGVTTGGGVSGTTATPIVGTLTPTVKSDIEDTKIKH